MPSFDIIKEFEIKRTARVAQLEAMFDVPISDKTRTDIHGVLPLEDKLWNIGAIVGPSGSGKSTILEAVFGKELALYWSHQSVVDDFAASLSMEDIVGACGAVGFNTIPAWTRPFSVLSTGEKFRCTLARVLAESRAAIVMDEFTSVVDRQVAQIASFAVQKYVRGHQKQMVVASCHYDILEWLQPDWVYDTGKNAFDWRSLRRRPDIEIEIKRCDYREWKTFAPFHYMNATLNKAARCYGLYIGGRIVSFCGILHRPHPRVNDIVGVSRVVTLPDWQGIGLAMAMLDKLGSAYSAVGKRLHNYPAHPSFIRSHSRSASWRMEKQGGAFSPRSGVSSTVGGFGGRPCAVFCYIGPQMESSEEARRFIDG